MRRLAGIAALCLALSACGSSVEQDPQLAQGKALYEANCGACHGMDGAGNGANWQQPNADGTFPPPPHTDDGHTWHHPDGQLYGIVERGGMGPNSAMPAFGDQLAHDEIIATLEYIKTFWSAETRAAQERISQDLPYPPAPAGE